MVSSDSQQAWVPLNREQAKQHPLYGVNGWLLVILVMLCIYLVVSIPVGSFILARQSGLRDIHARMALGSMITIQGILVAMFIVAIVIKYRYLLVSSWIVFPIPSLISVLIVSPTFSIFGSALMQYVENKNETALACLFLLIFRDITVPLYCTFSTRANVTTMNRVRANDPILKTLPDDGEVRGANVHQSEASLLSNLHSRKVSTDSGVTQMTKKPLVPNETIEALEPDILMSEEWITYYAYNDSIRRVFDELAAKKSSLGFRFAELFLQDPKDADLAKLAAQVLDEQKERQRFSENVKVEAAYRAMKEISEEAASEFRRVIGIMGEDVDLDEITRKIRNQFSVRPAETLNDSEMIEALLKSKLPAHERSIIEKAKVDAEAGSLSLFDQETLRDIYYWGVEQIRNQLPADQMTALEIIKELKGMGIEVDARAGGPYFIKRGNGLRDKLRNIDELRMYLQKELRNRGGRSHPHGML